MHPRVSPTRRLRGAAQGRTPPPALPGPTPAALYRTCVSAAPGWAGSRFSWPGPAGRRPWRAERPWSRVLGLSWETHKRPPRHATLTTPPDRPRRKPRVRRRRQPSAEPPARGARLARPGSAGRDARGGAQSIVGPGLPWPPASSLGRGWGRSCDFPAAAPPHPPPPAQCRVHSGRSVPGGDGTDRPWFSLLGTQIRSGTRRERVRSESTARPAGAGRAARAGDASAEKTRSGVLGGSACVWPPATRKASAGRVG